MTVSKTIWGRTGEVKIVPGPWWVQDKQSGELRVVEVLQDVTAINFFGTDVVYDFDKAVKRFEFLAFIPNPYD